MDALRIPALECWAIFSRPLRGLLLNDSLEAENDHDEPSQTLSNRAFVIVFLLPHVAVSNGSVRVNRN